MNSTVSNKIAFVYVTFLFFLWGFITVFVDSLIPRLKEVFELSYGATVLVQFAFFIAYFIFSIPSGYILSRIGYKNGILAGLFTMILGCLLFFPAAENRFFILFLLAFFVLAIGITMLQVAANPYIVLLGSETGASSRLNLSQAFNSLGTTIAPIFGALYLLKDPIKNTIEIQQLSLIQKTQYLALESYAVQGPFLLLSACITILIIIGFLVRLPKVNLGSTQGGYLKLLKNKMVQMGAFAIFVYVGAEVAIGSFLVNYFLEMNLAALIVKNEVLLSIANSIASLFNTSILESDSKSILGMFVVVYWGGAMIGRFIGAYLTKILPAVKVLSFFAAMAILMIIVSVATTGLVSMWAILGVGFFNSIMFPTIFSLSLKGLGNLKPQASGILCTAIVGGAIVPPMCGVLIDTVGFKLAFVLIMFCYIYIYAYGRYMAKSLYE